jgi:tetratricopeptide (TPR) repeat protein
MKRRVAFYLAAALAALCLTGAASAADDFEADLAAVRDAWAVANYRTPEDQREAAFEQVVARAAALSAKYPQRAEALIWEGIVLSTYAGARGGIGALGPAKKARARLEAALAIDETALEASAHTSLGALYHKVPGFPLAFGSERKARMHLEKALAISPGAIDANYFYGEFLCDEGEYEEALRHLETALRAPPRPGRGIADAERRKEIRALIAKVRSALDEA